MTALAKEPASRWPDAKSMRRALLEIRDEAWGAVPLLRVDNVAEMIGATPAPTTSVRVAIDGMEPDEVNSFTKAKTTP